MMVKLPDQIQNQISEADRIRDELDWAARKKHNTKPTAPKAKSLRKTRMRQTVLIADATQFSAEDVGSMESALIAAAPISRRPGRPREISQYADWIGLFAAMKQQGVKPPRRTISIEVCEFPGFLELMISHGYVGKETTVEGLKRDRDRLANALERKFVRITDAMKG